MLPNDLVCRSVLYPRGFAQLNVFELATFMRADRRKGTDIFVLSVGSRHVLRDEAGAHAYGVASAQVANQGVLRRSGLDELPADQVVHYLGFYDISYGDVTSVQSDSFGLEITYRPEHGSTAHFEIELRERAGITKNQRKQDKSIVELVLASRLVGPKRYLIEGEDVDLCNRLNGLPLPEQFAAPDEAV
ncbi:hypothetical protein NIM87_05885 [Devosia sp. XJ19-1]|uniref:Uncharacterized protein n=1 Tax=Devosia ureilytica TaxID=2952754 RepID=A0A9Q4AMV9_9HYPH|nr:hypothetical protein [Devosia ureilytica]MCP8883022.1 hypothetical protein [Devosia ureilytica]MCP8886610.1 hypothetical protein [Devosia ureilytica]